MRRFSAHYLKEVFQTLPRLAKLLLIFALVNAILIVGTTTLRVVSFGNMASIKAIDVGVYWDEYCISPVDVAPGVNLTSSSPRPLVGFPGIDWGFIAPGETKSVDVYVKNEGNVECTLDIFTEGWNPESAGDFIGFTSDYQGKVLGTEEDNNILKVSLTLYVPVDIQGVTAFQFQIVIQATG